MARIQGEQYSHGFSYCSDCHDKYRDATFTGVGRCRECQAKFTEQFVIYDRDKKVGSLPPNLKGKEA